MPTTNFEFPIFHTSDFSSRPNTQARQLLDGSAAPPFESSVCSMASTRNLKIKTGTCKRILKELHSYEKEIEREAKKTADMKERGADPYDLKQQENVLAESRMMLPDCQKRLAGALEDLKATLEDINDSNEQGAETDEAYKTVEEIEVFFQNAED